MGSFELNICHLDSKKGEIVNVQVTQRFSLQMLMTNEVSEEIGCRYTFATSKVQQTSHG